MERSGISIKATEWYGKQRSNNIYFDDQQYLPESLINLKVFKIKIWYGNIYQGGVVNGIQIFYKDRFTGAVYQTLENYGALYLVDSNEYQLGDDEYISNFRVQTINLVEYLELSTNKGTVIKEGKFSYSPESTFEHSADSIIIGIKGCYGNHLNRIAFYYINCNYYLTHSYSNPCHALSTQLYGDSHINGIQFNDCLLLKKKLFKYRIAKIVFWIGKLYHSRIINGIQFGYQHCLDSTKMKHSEENKGKNKAIEMKEYLLDDDEYLLNYKVRATYFVEYIEFVTNKKRVIQEGEKIGKLASSDSFKDDSNVILGIRGEYEADLCNVKFYYADMQFYKKIGHLYWIRYTLKRKRSQLIEKYKRDLAVLALIQSLLLNPFMSSFIFSYLSTSDDYTSLDFSKVSLGSKGKDNGDAINLLPKPKPKEVPAQPIPKPKPKAKFDKCFTFKE